MIVRAAALYYSVMIPVQLEYTAPTVGGDFWVGKLAAQRADGSELFHARLFNGNAQLGLGLNF